MRALYTFSIQCLVLAIKIAGIFNKKAWQAIDGRKKWREKLKNTLQNNKNEIIWFHISSLGEFEQARPLIVCIKTKYPQYKILITFFSPSGYNAQKKFEYADWIFYMPFDTVKNACDFLDIVQPRFIIFVKYEFWINFLLEIKRKKQNKNIKCFLISSVFRKHQPFFKWYGKIFIDALSVFDKIFVQDRLSVKLLKKIGYEKNVFLSGDTRVDRVVELAHQSLSFPEIEKFCNAQKTIIAGSTWPQDERILIKILPILKKNRLIKCIITPHDTSEKNILKLIQLLESEKLSYCRYTQIHSEKEMTLKDVLIIDTIGILNKIYRYGYLAYIGGGFYDGIHNILEPAAYGIPVIFGPKYEKFYEAVELIKLKSAFVVKNEDELYNQLDVLLHDTNVYTSASVSVKEFIIEHKGAVEKTLQVLNIDLTAES